MNTDKAASASKALPRLGLALGLGLLCAACVSLGKPFTFAGPGDITVGKTTKGNLLDSYGKPFRVGYDNGNEKWAYSYYRYNLFGDAQVQDLDIIFDKNGTVSSYTYESSNPYATDKALPTPDPQSKAAGQ